MINTLFEFVLTSSLTGTVLFLIISAIRPITKKTFSANWHCFMWLVVLVIMLFPLKLELPSREINIKASENIITETTDKIMPDVFDATEHTEKEKLSPLKNISVNYLDNIAIIWFVIALALFCIKILSYALLLRTIRKNSNAVNCPEITDFTKRKIVTRCSKNIASPLMLGIIKPQLILPDIEITSEQLNNILLHEMTHFKRKDILLKWLACFAKCIHWFNPAVHIINRQINTDCEIACDIDVIRNMSKFEKKNYINTILFLLTHSKTQSLPLTTAMASSKKILKERFTMIKNYNKHKKMIVLSIVIALVLVSASVFAGGLINRKINPYADNIITPADTDKINGNNFNFLVIGEDESKKADSIIVFSFNENKISVLSIPRNVQFSTENGFKRITDIISEKDSNQKIIDAIHRTLAIPINYYAKINISTVKKIVNELGDIEFNVPKDMVYNDPYQNLHINLKKGVQNLDGEKALMLLRFRGYPEGDFSRITTQQEFIKELIVQKRSHISKNTYAITKIISENVVTNYSMKNFIKDYKLIADVKNMEFYTLPVTNSTINGYFYNNIDFLKAENLLENFRFVDKKAVKEKLTWPCPASTTITNSFGTRVHPITGKTKNHNGIDIKASEGDNIVSAISGKVTKCGFDNKLGNFVTVQSANGIETTYGALSEISVKDGASISQGQIIGKAGSTGTSTGAHLHFEISVNGEFVNPKAYFE